MFLEMKVWILENRSSAPKQKSLFFILHPLEHLTQTSWIYEFTAYEKLFTYGLYTGTWSRYIAT